MWIFVFVFTRVISSTMDIFTGSVRYLLRIYLRVVNYVVNYLQMYNTKKKKFKKKKKKKMCHSAIDGFLPGWAGC